MERWHPIEGEKQCNTCNECKPLSAFSPHASAKGGRAPVCRVCRNLMAKDRAMLGRRKDRQVRKPCRVEIWPRTLGEALLDVRARKWAGPVDRSQPLRWAA